MGNGEPTAVKEKILEIQDKGYCVLRAHFARPAIDACRNAFWPVLLAYLRMHGHEPNRGPHRYSVGKGSTPVLSSDEARELLRGMDISTPIGLRDRAIIAAM